MLPRNYDSSPDFWNSVIASVLSYGSTEVPKVDHHGIRVPDPEKSGIFHRSVGERKGQIADWRASIPGSRRGVHAVEFDDRYSVHVDRFDPDKEPLKHLLVDSPKTLIGLLGAGLVSMLFFSLFGGRR
ncbi:MAG: hypothetical protein M1129_02810 [Candidatus Thermoplasmatota archaeon]|jgi:hypothetical protein|nr:hypothetical protein [Candidatus Thermoplasmatota archaeon]MCL5955798.1 hypothetical protein [Candidatus Thermoplasmatota archaeon]